MLNSFRPVLRAALASAALGALVPLAACNQAVPEQASLAQRLPELPATMPLALGEGRPLAYAPPARALPRVRPIAASRVGNPNDSYAWADDAWSYYDALDYAPPDYGFYYDDAEPWAWQGYDNSMLFVEPLAAGYRYYFYRPGDEYPYFIRDPDWGYGYDDGRLAVVYDAYGNIIPYNDYFDGPYLDYASRYYDRGYRLYEASLDRHPVFATSWYQMQPSYSLASLDWSQDLWQQPQWLSYHERTFAPRERYWDQERERRQAEAVRFAAWQDTGFQSPSPPRAIPSNWKRADWARNERWFAPPVSGFDGNLQDQQRAAERERQRTVSLARDTSKQDQVRLAALRERVQARPAVDGSRVEQVAQLRHQFESRRMQLASRDDRGAQRERAVIERQQQRLERAQQQMLRQQAANVRRDRGMAPERMTRVEQRNVREQRVNQAEGRRQDLQGRFDLQRQRQAMAETRQQDVRQHIDNQQRRQAQLEARAQADRGRQAQVQAQAEARQQRQAQMRAEAGARSVQREQMRQAAEQQQAARQAAGHRQQAARQAAEQRQQATRQVAEQRNAAQQQARQAAEQQRAAQEQARQAAQQPRAQQQQVAQANPGNGKPDKDPHGHGPH